MLEAEHIVYELKRKIRIAGINQRSRVMKAKNINTDFENAVKPVDGCKAVI
jgi:hypothetical protein